ncbi:MAG: nucleotidyltransferase domain-containing protein [archaeon]
MAKTEKKETKKDENQDKTTIDALDVSKLNLPKEAKEKLEKIKGELEKFKKEVVEKFDKYIMGITLLPPRMPFPQMQGGMGMPPGMGMPSMPTMGMGSPMAPGQIQQPNKDEISIMVLVDDNDSQKMSKYELKAKLSQIIAKIGTDINPNIVAETIILSELWQSCYDGKYDLTARVATGAPVYDTGMLAAVKISEIHKQMVLKKFEKYIVTYVLAGSLVQGKAKPDSDIDVFVVIDDTDVKKMTRIELKDKLRAIIIGMGLEAGEMTGIRNKLNIQVYILTDFWENIKEANPIIFTFLRDGIPFYDRGIFMPWKQLLQMGRIKPSQEAIDLFITSGDQMISRVKFKLNTVGMEDTFYAILTPSQAAIMMYGIAPPTPKETPDLMREIFVKKEKLLENEYVDILEANIKLRKDLEHGTKKELTGKEIDKLLEDSDRYLKRIKKLFKQIEKVKEEENIVHLYDTSVTMLRDVLRLEGVESVKEEELVKVCENNLVNSGKMPQKYVRMIKETLKAKKDYDAGSLTKTDISNVQKDSSELHRFLVEYIQRKRGKEMERTKIRVKYGKLYGEVILLGKHAYVIHDLDSEEKQISKAAISEDGALVDMKESSHEELEKALTEEALPNRAYIKQPIFENLREIFGKDVEIMVSQ